MLRELVRSYYRIRYFPRLLVQMLNGITSEIATIRHQDPPKFDGGPMLDNLQHELSSFCDDMTRFMIASRSSAAEHAARLSALHPDLDTILLETQGLQTQAAALRATLDAETQGLRSQAAALRDTLQSETQDLRRLTSAFRDALDTHMMELASRLKDSEAAALGEAERLQAAVSQQGKHLAALGNGMAALSSEMARQIADVAAQSASSESAARELVARESANLSARVEAQSAEIDRIGRMVSQQIRLLPSNLFEADTADQVRDTLALLQPVAVRNVGKIRVGRDLDGGYVMLDDFERIGAALSLGIADDVSWDEDVAAHDINVLQFDPSVSAPPVENARFRFESLRVVPHDTEGGISLDTIVRSKIEDSNAMLLLKIDIEGAEWDVFNAVDESVLSRFSQVVCEFHDLDRLAEPAFGRRARRVFEKLARTHAVTHVHGNNCSNFANVGNVIVPQVLEVSFALRDIYAFSETVESFPTALDRPNQPGRADLFLGSFQFARNAKTERQVQESVLF
jgi:hypothetical protein